jgi:hypothetical protein
VIWVALFLCLFVGIRALATAFTSLPPHHGHGRPRRSTFAAFTRSPVPMAAEDVQLRAGGNHVATVYNMAEARRRLRQP